MSREIWHRGVDKKHPIDEINEDPVVLSSDPRAAVIEYVKKLAPLELHKLEVNRNVADVEEKKEKVNEDQRKPWQGLGASGKSQNPKSLSKAQKMLMSPKIQQQQNLQSTQSGSKKSKKKNYKKKRQREEEEDDINEEDKKSSFF